MKEIKKYIQFAIDNGFESWGDTFEITLLDQVIEDGYEIDFWIEDLNFNGEIRRLEKTINFIQLITSKEFIVSLARGIYNNNEGNIERGRWLCGKFIKMYYGDCVDRDIAYTDLIELITFEQSVAIREIKLEEFITNILPGQN